VLKMTRVTDTPVCGEGSTGEASQRDIVFDVYCSIAFYVCPAL